MVYLDRLCFVLSLFAECVQMAENSAIIKCRGKELFTFQNVESGRTWRHHIWMKWGRKQKQQGSTESTHSTLDNLVRSDGNLTGRG